MSKATNTKRTNINQCQLIKAFGVIEDPRKSRKKKHPLENILVISLLAVASGANSWYQIEDYCAYNEEWFSQYLDMTNGSPSHDTFRRVFSILCPDIVQTVLQEWVKEQALSNQPGRQISFDGKTLRGSRWGEDAEQVHILNAFDTTEQITLGQVAVEKKANEIIAMPELIDKLELEGSVCTGDALLTQKSIVKKLQSKKADYCLALKKNQLNLLKQVESHFANRFPSTKKETNVEKNRGWVETREVWASGVDRIKEAEKWDGLKSVIKITVTKSKKEKYQVETRYYISSLDADPKQQMTIIRNHWSIENQLHRTLDMIFKEDECQARERNSAANLSVLRKLAGSILRRIPGRSLKQRMMGMQMSNSFREKFINCEF